MKKTIIKFFAIVMLAVPVLFSSCKQVEKVASKMKPSDDKKLVASLKDREARISELEMMLARKDSAARALKDAISKALTGFIDEGLSVEQSNGRVTISMEDRLLFAPGSTDVDKRGVDALRQLARILQDKKDIHIVVEGHTDETPVTATLPSGAKDNWDLSVMRATAVVRIMTKNSTLEPGRITAAGRGPFVPLTAVKTTEGRKKNRRTEIILTPNMDELMKLLASE
jgi:chemotaxis protein MotB